MTTLQILALARSVERVLVVSFSGMSLLLGWNLFRAHMIQDQRAELTGKGFAIKLEKVGPGVFFALFGAACLAVALARPLHFDESAASSPSGSMAEKQPVTGESSELKGSWLAGAGTDEVGDEVKAINTLGRVVLPVASAGLSPTQKDAGQKSVAILDRLKRKLLLAKFGQAFEQYEFYSARAALKPAEIGDLPKTARDQYYEIDQLVTGTMLGER